MGTRHSARSTPAESDCNVASRSKSPGEKDPDAGRTLIEGFTGDAPVYSLLKHPRALGRALKSALRS